jgi:hypothetical protein
MSERDCALCSGTRFVFVFDRGNGEWCLRLCTTLLDTTMLRRPWLVLISEPRLESLERRITTSLSLALELLFVLVAYIPSKLVR